MPANTDELIDDLEAEQAALERVLSLLPAAAWERPTHAPGWAVRDQVAHLASTDEVAAQAISDPEAFVAGLRGRDRSGGEAVPGFLARGRALAPAALLAWWGTASRDLIAAARTLAPGVRVPWFGPAMSPASFITARLMETWSHGLDVVDVVDVERPDTDRLRHVALIGVLTRPHSYRNRSLPEPTDPVRVELTAPSGALWTFGEPDASDSVHGTAADFCRVVTQRRHLADTNLVVNGPAALEWLRLAQAFAGPPGEGRRPGQFPKSS